MVKRSVKINAILNIIKSLLSVIFPLITYPYATRILGVENLGKVNYGTSIVSYFSLIAAFGITSYAIREGAKRRESKKDFSKLANELFSINIITTLFAYFLLIVLLFTVNKLKSYRLLIALQSLTIVFTTFGIEWINIIYEDYLYITIRGILTNVLSLIALFIFVKSKSDYYIYALITVLTNAVVCIMNFFYCKKYIGLKLILHINFKPHLKKMFIFFVNAVAVSIYVSSDTTMLGWMIGDYSVGIYSVAVKIYNIMKLLLVAIYSVALPRLSFYYAQQDEVAYRKLFSQIVSVILLLLLPVATGICMLSKEIIIIIGGQDFLAASNTLAILGVSLVFAILGGLVTQCLNISVGMERINANATILSAIVNVALNVPFIYFLQQNGAAITTVIAELIVFAFCFVKSKNYIKSFVDKRNFYNLIHSFIGVFIVVLSSIFVHHLRIELWGTLILTIFMSVSIYTIVLILLKNTIVLDVLEKAKMKIRN